MTPRERRAEQIVNALVEVGIHEELAQRIVHRHRNHTDEEDALWNLVEDYAAFVRAQRSHLLAVARSDAERDALAGGA